MQYLKQARLAGAHRDLQAGGPACGDTVTAIAARWGFTPNGTFPADYRRIYGRTPSQTLHGDR